jgi:hypothetical protein
MLAKQLRFIKWPALSMCLCFATYASAQSTPTQNPSQNPSQDSDVARPAHDQDRDINHEELARFNQFLQTHPDTAEQLRKDPSLVNSQQFVSDHPALQSYLQDHPELRQQLQQNPNAFMRDEDRYERDRSTDDRDRDRERRELASFNQFLDSHRETAEQLRKDPSLVDKHQFLTDHPALQSYLQDHPELRQQLQRDPNAFMRDEDRYEHDLSVNDRDRDRRELASFNQFLDSHRETAEQLRKDPSLADKHQFLTDHPALQSYLQDHPEVRQQLQQDPNAFMREEDRYEHQEAMNRGDDFNRGNGFDRNADRDHDAQRHFGEFLGSHSNIAEQLSKDPSLVKSQEYLQDHPELRDYLSSHPEVRQQLMADPQAFVKSTQQFNNGQGMKSPDAGAPSQATTPKPKQQ